MGIKVSKKVVNLAVKGWSSQGPAHNIKHPHRHKS